MAKGRLIFIGVAETEEERAARKEAAEKPFRSPQDWKASWRERTLPQAELCRQYDNIGNHHDGWLWVEGKEIRLFTDGSVAEEAVEPVIAGITDLIDDLNLDIKVNYYKEFSSHPSVTEPVKLSTENGILDAEKLGRYFLAEVWRQPPEGRPHADALITGRPLKLGGKNFGQSEFSLGYLVMALTDGTNNPKDKRNRQSQKDGMDGLVRRIAKHEAGHLLGYNLHHEDTKVVGYAEPEDCLMYWRSSTGRICPKCRDALVGLWEGLEKETGKKYFKA